MEENRTKTHHHFNDTKAVGGFSQEEEEHGSKLHCRQQSLVQDRKLPVIKADVRRDSAYFSDYERRASSSSESLPPLLPHEKQLRSFNALVSFFPKTEMNESTYSFASVHTHYEERRAQFHATRGREAAIQVRRSLNTLTILRNRQAQIHWSTAAAATERTATEIAERLCDRFDADVERAFRALTSEYCAAHYSLAAAAATAHAKREEHERRR